MAGGGEQHKLQPMRMKQMKRAAFYHIGCKVCVSAEKELAEAIDPSKIKLEMVDLRGNKARIGEALKAGVKSVPAIVTEDGNVFHINFGASMDEVK
jgi:glutaredoxin 3